MANMDREVNTDYLYGEARGKMFGVLVCKAPDGATETLKAFSGQYNGQWELKAGLPPLFDVQQFHTSSRSRGKKIKALRQRRPRKTADENSVQQILEATQAAL